MENILLTIIMMLIIIWTAHTMIKVMFKLNNSKNGFIANNLDETLDLNKILSKNVAVIFVLFILCFFFVSLVQRQVGNNYQNIVDKLSKKSLDSSPSDLIAAQESLNKKITQGYFEILQPKQVKTLFKDIAGLYEPKDELADLIRFLHDPVQFQRLGAKPPKGILLYGQPGTGKTMLARALAGEARVSFIATSGSQFEEEYVGIGAARIRELFRLAREQAPCVIFIDEIDSLAFKRHTKHNPAWAAQTVNQLLTEMDGLNDYSNKGILIVAASNQIDALDSAILRPGRLDRHIKLELPTQVERKELFSLYLKKIVYDPEVNPERLAKITAGFSSADIANLVNEAAIDATKNNKLSVDFDSFEIAKDRFVLGSTRKATVITDKEKKITAYHEAGHALVGYFLPEHNPIYKVTIAPRGPSLGHTNFEPLQDVHTYSKTEIENMITSSLGGRIAEELTFGKNNITTGAENDLRYATELAISMITKWGYSEKLGLIYSADKENLIAKNTLENETKLILQACYKKAKDLLIINKDKLDKLAGALLEEETLDKEQVAGILGRKI